MNLESWGNEWTDHNKAIERNNDIKQLQDDLRFALSHINWDCMTSEDLKKVQRLCVEQGLMDDDGNWHR
jgi:hypothetical protein